MSLLRFKMVEAAIDHKAVEVKAPEGSPSEYFGTKVFGRETMRRYLNKTFMPNCSIRCSGGRR